MENTSFDTSEGLAAQHLETVKYAEVEIEGDVRAIWDDYNSNWEDATETLTRCLLKESDGFKNLCKTLSISEVEAFSLIYLVEHEADPHFYITEEALEFAIDEHVEWLFASVDGPFGAAAVDALAANGFLRTVFESDEANLLHYDSPVNADITRICEE
jgi:hypothetical protein